MLGAPTKQGGYAQHTTPSCIQTNTDRQTVTNGGSLTKEHKMFDGWVVPPSYNEEATFSCMNSACSSVECADCIYEMRFKKRASVQRLKQEERDYVD